ncbi:LysR family transcriptional regulator [Burkholderia multivorans]|uniref:LysR family transcriptional regulator n=1 Tax=Burkholderia multivorans TaxID=87883 RepID=UPI0019882E75|nr:LysR family transcriptional regulator [Burkholderia multivorans]CAB5285555.1 LysR family transcriptional regulator [Burkholderia multivorans]CAB5302514.1 LysR family transcriptional regulator [Burkholderia multivorans]CAB5302683.1 LysR family transcriptional regulator [Burkholderia multivorans]CAB5303663.1 LysR family transcriptional regulator [Burkholderia multivorans]CAB5304189.1 LysR family transcriptional regulator [Burkholderia multivorans]
MAFDSRLLSGIGVLSAVIEAGSFARAGETMGLTQPAVSRAVARLEERVGIRIFNRTARAISLTDEGRRFYEAVAPLLAGIEEAAVDAGQSQARVKGKLRVNVDATFGHYALAPRLSEFLDRFPDLSVEIRVRDRMGDLVADGFDVAVRFGVPEPSSYRARLLLETRVLTCASKGYIARYGEPQHPKDLAAGHQCVFIRDPTTGRPYEWEFHRGSEVIPLAVAGRLMVNDTGSLLGACLGGTGIAQLLEIYAKDIIADGKVILLLPDWAEETFPLYAYYHGSNFISAKVRVFLDFVRELVT